MSWKITPKGAVQKPGSTAELALPAPQAARALVASAPLSAASVEKLVLASAHNDLETQMAIEGQLVSQCAASPDGREGIQAFVDKRKPVFDGGV